MLAKRVIYFMDFCIAKKMYDNKYLGTFEVVPMFLIVI